MEIRGNIDFRKPGKDKDDFRTSSYRGLFVTSDCIGIPPTLVPGDVCKKFRYVIDCKMGKSECQTEYTRKTFDTEILRNPTLKNIQNIKPYDNTRLCNAPKPVTEFGSTFRSDYGVKTETNYEFRPQLHFVSVPKEAEPEVVVRRKPGYRKYLDPSTTTYKLSYVDFAFNDLGIGHPDAITYWNWKKDIYHVSEVMECMCDKYRSRECPKRYNEYRSQVKCVPNAGQTSESKSSYVYQTNFVNYDITHVKNLSMASSDSGMKMATENMIYGVGDNSARYVL